MTLIRLETMSIVWSYRERGERAGGGERGTGGVERSRLPRGTPLVQDKARRQTAYLVYCVGILTG
jgi:hypothetical protein